jgi:hypothetical protein
MKWYFAMLTDVSAWRTSDPSNEPMPLSAFLHHVLRLRLEAPASRMARQPSS